MPSTLRWLLIQTSMPRRISSLAMSAWISEKPTTKSGRSARMRSILADVNALTLGFSSRACGGRTVKPLIPTMRSCSPSAYRTSVGSSVRQTIRRGPLIGASRCRVADQRQSWIQHPLAPHARRVALVNIAFVQAEFGAPPDLDDIGHDAEARPAWRPRHRATGEVALGRRQALVEYTT